MKTFEQRYTAWVDGKLMGRELAQFEKEIEANPALVAEKKSIIQMGNLLRAHVTAPALANPDFFRHQIMHRVEVESPMPKARSYGWFNWSIPQVAAAGAASLLVAAGLYFALIPSSEPIAAGAPYFAEIVDVRTSDPSISATPVYDPRTNVTVLWIDGLDYLPASYKLQ